MFELGQRNVSGGKWDRHREKHFFTAVILVVITLKTVYEKCIRFEVEVEDIAHIRVHFKSRQVLSVTSVSFRRTFRKTTKNV